MSEVEDLVQNLVKTLNDEGTQERLCLLIEGSYREPALEHIRTAFAKFGSVAHNVSQMSNEDAKRCLPTLQ